MNRPAAMIDTVLKTVALAMGVAAVVLTTLRAAPPDTLITLLGLGLFCLAVSALNAPKR